MAGKHVVKARRPRRARDVATAAVVKQL